MFAIAIYYFEHFIAINLFPKKWNMHYKFQKIFRHLIECFIFPGQHNRNVVFLNLKGVSNVLQSSSSIPAISCFCLGFMTDLSRMDGYAHPWTYRNKFISSIHFSSKFNSLNHALFERLSILCCSNECFRIYKLVRYSYLYHLSSKKIQIIWSALLLSR